MTVIADVLHRALARLPGMLRMLCAAVLASGLASFAQAAVIDNTAQLYQYDSYTKTLDGNGNWVTSTMCPPGQPDCPAGLLPQANWTTIDTSNTVAVNALPPPTPSTVRFWQHAPDFAGLSYTDRQSFRFDGGSHGPSSAGPFTGLSTPNVFNPATNNYDLPLDLSSAVDVHPARTFHAGEPVFITLEDANRNADPAVRELIVLRLQSFDANGNLLDEEWLQLLETGPSSGIFSAVIQSVGPSQIPAQHDGRLSVDVGSRFAADYQDAWYPTDRSANDALVDPFGIVFDSLTGAPVDGATVTLMDVTTGMPATVFADDGISPFPATVKTGPAGGPGDDPGDALQNVVIPAGGFRFPFVHPGNYRFVVTPPASYAAPASDVLTCPACGAHAVVAPGSDLRPFVIVPGPALNIDIPVDPLSTSLVLEKIAGRAEASIGDHLQYTLVVRNADSTLPATAVKISDTLPAGLRYMNGSLRIDGKSVADPGISADGRVLDIDFAALAPAMATFPAGVSHQVTYVVAVSAGTRTGDVVNVAQASANGGALTSKAAPAAVRIQEPFMSARATIIGRVYEGDCRGPMSELSGVPNVRVLLEDGTYVQTDKDGYYHIEGVRAGTHVVQIDLESLPGALEMQQCIENTRFAGRSYSQFVDVEGGGLWRADFHTRKRIDDVGVRMQSELSFEEKVTTPPPRKKVKPVVFAPREVKNYTLKAEFDSCRATLKPEGTADVEALVEDLREEKIDRIELTGNTDSQRLSVRCRQQYKDNYELSDARAKTVGGMLADALGLKPEQIATTGRGPDNPVASNATPEGMARNRRTEVKVFLKADLALADVKEEETVEEEPQAPVRTVTFKGMTHRIEVDGSVPVKDLRVMALLPEGYHYAPVSTRIDGLGGSGPVVNEGMLTFRLGDIEQENWQHVIEFGVEAEVQEAPVAKSFDKQVTLHANFDSCSTTLKAEGEVAVRKLIKDLRDVNIERLELTGHTDNQRLSPSCLKKFADNHALSRARAQAIGDVVAKALGIPADRIVANGMGPDVPVADNGTREGMAANRRTEVAVKGTVIEAPSAGPTGPACEKTPYSIKSMATFQSVLKKKMQTPAVENRLACGSEATAKLRAAAAAGATAASPEGNAAAATTPVVPADTATPPPAPAEVATPAGNDTGDNLSRADSGRQQVVVDGGIAKALPQDVISRTRARDAILDDADAAGANTDWLDGARPGREWVFPPAGYNPRSPSTRIVIKHAPGDKVVLKHADGSEVSGLNFDGTRKSGDERTAVSVWRGVSLVDGGNAFIAEITAVDSGEMTTLENTIVYANAPVRAEFVPAQSVLLADGVHKPVVAVRLLDRDGNPVRKGIMGPVDISLPYIAAAQEEQQQKRQLAGLDRFQPQYRVEGDEGIAYIELAPTTESGAVTLGLSFDVGGGMRRTQEIRTWIEPAPRDWVVVGFAEGTIGYNTLKKNIQPLKDDGMEDGSYSDGQVNLYAKGRVKGNWLLTMAYDSSNDDERDRQKSLLGTIDPNEYYTLYGDGADQRHDAPSQDNLYLKLERGQFYALFGDYDTGLTQTELSRYSRTLNGVKVQKGDGKVTYVLFAAQTPQTSVRRELQGNGTSGLYLLSPPRGGIVLNSERIRIETRNRYHSHVIVESRMLARHIDYDIDYSAGTLYFRQPVPSRDQNFNPVFIVAEFESFASADEQLNAGGRIATTFGQDNRYEVGVSAVRDEDWQGASSLQGVDAKVRLGKDTVLRTEVANSEGEKGIITREGEAWLVELEHHDQKYDALAYTRRTESGFGVGQQNGSEVGQEKTGLIGRMKLDEHWSTEAEANTQENLASRATRDALQGKLRYDTERGGWYTGAQWVQDEVGSGPMAGTSVSSEQVTLGGNRYFMDRRLELSAQGDTAVGGNKESVDYPDRLTLGAGYRLTDHARLLAGQEFTDGRLYDTSTTRVGLQTLPWKGARLDTTLNQSTMGESGPRTFAQYGLTQAVLLNDRWGLDFSVDANDTLHESTRAPLQVNPAYPVASGGSLGGRTVSEDYYAFSAGATYRAPVWSWNGRLESRNGDSTDKYGLVSNFLREAKAGVAFASGLEFFRTWQTVGGDGLATSLDFSLAWRPLGSHWSVLDRLEFKYESLEGGNALGSQFGDTGINTVGNADSQRVINNLSLNRVSREWTGKDRKGNLFNRYERNQWSLYYGAKYQVDNFDGLSYSGYTDLLGTEVRHDITDRWDIGLQASSLNHWETHTHKYAVGPMVGFSPVDNGWITVGYNHRGFHDADFDAARYTGEGFYLQLRFKFDQDTRFGRKPPEDSVSVDGRRAAVTAASR